MGGAEKMVTGLADALVAKGHEVCIVFLTGTAAVLPAEAKIRVISLGIVSNIHVVNGFIKLNRLIRKFQPDVVHSHMVHANIFTRLVRLITPMARLISTAHNTNEGGRLRMWAYRLTDSLADLSTNVSAEAVAAFVACGAVAQGRMIAVPNGIDTARFALNNIAGEVVRLRMNVAPEVKVILAVGRLTQAKDYPNLLNAYCTIDNIVVKTQLWIVGDGELHTELQNSVCLLNLNDRVKFLGVRHDVPDLMSAADVFVLPSAWEGFGLVVAEAMACERVVVATDCGGVKEVLGNAGYLVKPQDAKALAIALKAALQLPEDARVAMGHAARKWVVEQYSLDIAVERWLQIYAGQIKVG